MQSARCHVAIHLSDYLVYMHTYIYICLDDDDDGESELIYNVDEVELGAEQVGLHTPLLPVTC
jgi:hypothetical protein